MIKTYRPAIGIGPGSQPMEAGDQLDFMPLPRTMHSYRPPILPEPEELGDCAAARRRAAELQDALEKWQPGEPARVVDLADLDPASAALLDQILGEGEVSILCSSNDRLRIQEAVLAGVWRVAQVDETGAAADSFIEVGDIPRVVRREAEAASTRELELSQDERPPGVQNAPAVLIELIGKSRDYEPGQPAHVINLTLLPQTPEDIAFLKERLGVGPITILSRGYGNCRITSTCLRDVWWVQYFNSNDTLILNTLEVVDVPSVACAAPEDLEDSAERLREIREALL